jgi:D-methionine transport system substrate-binding protein
MKIARYLLLSTFLIVSLFASDHSRAQEAPKAELKVGFVPGPYIDEFKAGVAPELQKKGYSASSTRRRR